MIDIDSKYYSEAYFAEEAEYEAGIHPTQVLERIQKCLYETDKLEYDSVTFLDWNCDGPRVKVSIDGAYYGIFNYDNNKFEEENK